MVLSQRKPQKKEKGIAKKVASEVMIPTSTNVPSTAPVIYRGRKIDSKPNAISCKKNPSNHMPRA